MNANIVEVARRAASGIGDTGLMNIQLIRDSEGVAYVHDFNPWMASGVNLSIEAGAPYLRWLVDLMLGRRLSEERECVKEGYRMACYREGLFWRV